MTARFQPLETVSEIRNFEPLGTDARAAPETLLIKRREFSAKLNGKVCKCCLGDHLVDILEFSAEKRFVVVKRNSLCSNCLTSAHRLNECRDTLSCPVCRSNHNKRQMRGGNIKFPKVYPGAWYDFVEPAI